MSASRSESDNSSSAGPAALDQPSEALSPGKLAQGAPLNLRIVQGPLKTHENHSIISQYNSLASADISTQDFLRWIQDSPEGPAWHAVLETDEGEMAGHTSLIPIRATHDGRSLVAAKSEYSFIREEFRASKIRGFEQTGRLKNLIYIDELFKFCRSKGWSPLLISTSTSFHRVFRSIACYPVNFPLWECLLVLRPGEAARNTPNLRRWQRASLMGTGLIQSAFWAPTLFFSGRSQALRMTPPSETPLQQDGQPLAFFEDQESLAWRYPEEQYARIAAEANAGADLIVKFGSANRYLRVCQWRVNSAPPTPALVSRLVQMARGQRALGVRWAVYGNDARSAALVGRLRSLGFLCARRVRTLLINTAQQELLDPSRWNLTDAMFSFDL